ncbi:MAG: asparagine--tRNA ligase, partial [Atopobiaceae bacterium]|nr:asparagine--tRNA ligase [Atopobiaceae bacterium]
MERTRVARLFADAEALGGTEVTVCGWLRSVRDMKQVAFVTINDGSCFRDLQVVLSRDTFEAYDEVCALSLGTALVVRGELVLTPQAKQPIELRALSVEVEGTSAPDYPLQKKRTSLEFLRTQQHLRPRTNLFRAVFRVRSVAAYAIHRFFQERGFVYVHTPIITTSDAEGAGEMFRVTTLDLDNLPRLENGEVDYSKDFFGHAASLTVSGQLQGENFAMAFGDIYTFGPTFRAENSN